jgi:hypothetical protein
MIEKMNNFTYLGYKLSFQGEVDLLQKILKYAKAINEVLKPTIVQKHTWIHLYKILACPVLCYRSEVWTISKDDILIVL